MIASSRPRTPVHPEEVPARLPVPPALVLLALHAAAERASPTRSIVPSEPPSKLVLKRIGSGPGPARQASRRRAIGPVREGRMGVLRAWPAPSKAPDAPSSEDRDGRPALPGRRVRRKPRARGLAKPPGLAHNPDPARARRRSGDGRERRTLQGRAHGGGPGGWASASAWGRSSSPGGLLGGSVALVSDAAHSLVDALISAALLVALILAQRPADREHPYGHARVESLAGQGIAVILIALALAIGWEALSGLGRARPAARGVHPGDRGRRGDLPGGPLPADQPRRPPDRLGRPARDGLGLSPRRPRLARRARGRGRGEVGRARRGAGPTTPPPRPSPRRSSGSAPGCSGTTPRS